MNGNVSTGRVCKPNTAIRSAASLVSPPALMCLALALSRANKFRKSANTTCPRTEACAPAIFSAINENIAVNAIRNPRLCLPCDRAICALMTVVANRHAITVNATSAPCNFSLKSGSKPYAKSSLRYSLQTDATRKLGARLNFPGVAYCKSSSRSIRRCTRAAEVASFVARMPLSNNNKPRSISDTVATATASFAPALR